MKLSPRFYGPYRILQRVRQLAYKLDLSSKTRMHPIFHILNLKKRLGSNLTIVPTLPPISNLGDIQPELERVLVKRIKKVSNGVMIEVVIKCKGSTEEDSTWEELHCLCLLYPYHEGKVL